MNVIQVTARSIRQLDPSISEDEAMQMAAQQHAPQSRTDGAPSGDLGVDPGLAYPEQKYRYNPVSREWEVPPSQQDLEADARASGRYGYRHGGQEAFGSQDEADAYSRRPVNGPSQEDLDRLQTTEYNQAGTGWVTVYHPETGQPMTRRRAPAPETTVQRTTYVTDAHGNRVQEKDAGGNPVTDKFGRPVYKVASQGGVMVGGKPLAQSEGYRPAEDTPGANLAAGYSGATGFRDWTVDGPVPEYAQGYDWGGQEEGWANAATGGRRVGGPVDNRDVSPDMPQFIPGASGSAYDQTPVLMDSPNGPVWVYGYDPASQSTRDANAKATKDELQLRRMAEKAGITMAEARNGTIDSIRDLAMDRRNADKRSREQAYRDQSMLAGNDPGKNLVNAYNRLSPENQQQAMLGLMFPGGASPLDVDVARAMAEARLNVANTLSSPEQTAMMQHQMDQQNPTAAGARHISEGQYDTPQAQAELDRLAQSYDTTYGGFSYENEMALAKALQQPPYNIQSQAEAEAIAHRYANNQRWWWTRTPAPATSQSSTAGPSSGSGGSPPPAAAGPSARGGAGG